MGVGGRLATLALGGAVGMLAATQYVGWVFHGPEAFSAGLRLSPDFAIYPPWSVLAWRLEFGAEQPRTFAVANVFLLAGLLCGMFVGQVFPTEIANTPRVRGWGGRAEARAPACWPRPDASSASSTGS